MFPPSRREQNKYNTSDLTSLLKQLVLKDLEGKPEVKISEGKSSFKVTPSLNGLLPLGNFYGWDLRIAFSSRSSGQRP